jgi:hypothetical protein
MDAMNNAIPNQQPEEGILHCKNCGCGHIYVTNTYKQEIRYRGRIKQIIRRRRLCRYCKKAFITVEWEEDENNKGFPAITELPPDPSAIPPAPPFL